MISIGEKIKFLFISLALLGSLQSFTQQMSKNAFELDTLDGMKIQSTVEEMPEFEGGNAGLMRYIAKNINYPSLKKAEMQSQIHVSFVIDTLGNVRRVKITQPMNEGRLTKLEQYCIGFFEDLPQWSPGKHNGKKVPVRMEKSLHIDWSF